MTNLADKTRKMNANTVPGMPAYTPEVVKHLDQKGAAIGAILKSGGYARIAPPVMEPAEVFLEQSGEAIRRRIYVFTDPMGRELCLRPDLTIPACRMYLRGETGTPDENGVTRLTYDGPAFRYQGDEENRLVEFRQLGLECIGGSDESLSKLDAEVLDLALQSLKAANTLDKANLNMGDLGLFSGLLEALDMPEQWRTRLARAFWRHDQFESLLNRYAGQNSQDVISDARSVLAQTLSRLEKTEARAMVESVLDVAGIEAVGGRSVSEIVDRFIAQAEEKAAAPLSPETIALINSFLELKGHPSEVMEQVHTLATDAGLNISKAIARFTERWSLIEPKLEEAGLMPDRIHFATEFGRTMEYYTGFVFELTTNREGPDGRLLVGGRYDKLLEQLGSSEAAPAAGFALTLERVLLAANDLRVGCGR